MKSTESQFVPEFFIIPLPRPAFLPGVDLKCAVLIVQGRQSATLVAEELEQRIRGWNVDGRSTTYVLAETIYEYDDATVGEIRERIREYEVSCSQLPDEEIEDDWMLRAHRNATLILESLQEEVQASSRESAEGIEIKQDFSRSSLIDRGRKMIELSDALQDAINAADVTGVLHVLARSIESWAVSLKTGLFKFFEDSNDSRFQRVICAEHGPLRPGFILMPFVGAPQAYDHVELAIGLAQAEALAKRISELEKHRQKFADAVAKLATTWDDNENIETWAWLDEHRSTLRHASFDVCGFIHSLIRLIQSGAVGSQNAPSPQVAMDDLERSEGGLEKFSLATQNMAPIGEQMREIPANQSAGTHAGDDLLRFLADQPGEMAAVVELSEDFREPNMLRVCDLDELIEFGTRRHCSVGPVGNSEQRVEDGWYFSSVTGPKRIPMKDIIAEAMSYSGDERIRLHVRLTDEKGRNRVARLRTNLNTTISEPKVKTAKTDWRDVQRRLLVLYDRSDSYTTIVDLATRMKCSPSTIHKAIKNSTKLKAWQASYKKGKKSQIASSLNEFVQDNVRDKDVVDPSDVMTDEDIDKAMRQLIEQAEPEEKNKLNNLSQDEQRQLAKVYYQQNLDIDASPLDLSYQRKPVRQYKRL